MTHFFRTPDRRRRGNKKLQTRATETVGACLVRIPFCFQSNKNSNEQLLLFPFLGMKTFLLFFSEAYQEEKARQRRGRDEDQADTHTTRD